jgi:hypothetical protein
MKRRNINPMDKKEFEVYTQKIVDTLGDDISGFFTVGPGRRRLTNCSKRRKDTDR